MTRPLASIALIAFSAPVVIGSALFAGDIETATGRYASTSRDRTTIRGTASPDYDSNTRIHRDKMVKALDTLRNKVEEWGVVTISAPVAVLSPKAFYVPDNIVTADAAYRSAQSDVQASAVQATEVGISNQFGATVVPGVPTIIPPVPKPPKGGTATQNTTTTSTVTSPPAGATAPASPAAAAPPPNPNDQDLPPAPLPAGTIAPINLGPMPTPTKSVAAALREAQDNLMREKIYTQMSYPNGIEGYNKVIFAIVEVSCNPGWRTKEHYIAECSASLEYCDLYTREHVSLGEQRSPTVFSVLPLLDAQTVEMANSQRDVTQLAFQLAASLPAHGVNVRAKDLFQFVRRYSRDLRSRTPIPVVNSFSSGGTFGFRFSPSFQALRDPAEKNARAGNVLLPTSFPALITVVMHDEDIPSVEKGAVEPGILTHVSTRWFLKDRPPLWQLPKRLFSPMRRDTAEMGVSAAETVANFYLAKDDFQRETRGTEQELFNPMYEEARRNIIALQAKGIGRDWPISLNNAFLKAKKKEDEKTRTRVERLEDYSDNIENLQKKAEEANTERQGTEGGATKANTILIQLTDEKGGVKKIEFDKRPFGNISAEALASIVTQTLAQKGGGEGGNPDANGAKINKVEPPNATLGANETDQKFIISGPGLDDVKGAELGDGLLTTKDVKSKVKGKSLAISFKFPSIKDADKSKLKDGIPLDLKLVDDKDEEVATKEKAITLSLKDKAPNPASSVSPSPAGATTSSSPAKPVVTVSPSATSAPNVTPDGTVSPIPKVKKSP